MSLPNCPKYNSEFAYEDGGMFICPECYWKSRDDLTVRITPNVTMVGSKV